MEVEVKEAVAPLNPLQADIDLVYDAMGAPFSLKNIVKAYETDELKAATTRVLMALVKAQLMHDKLPNLTADSAMADIEYKGQVRAEFSDSHRAPPTCVTDEDKRVSYVHIQTPMDMPLYVDKIRSFVETWKTASSWPLNASHQHTYAIKLVDVDKDTYTAIWRVLLRW